MLSRTLSYISHHAIAIVALICSLLALAGASYAAINLPKNSVGNTQIKRGAVTPPKFSKQVGGYVRMYAIVDAKGKLQFSSPRARLSRLGQQLAAERIQLRHDLVEADGRREALCVRLRRRRTDCHARLRAMARSSCRTCTASTGTHVSVRWTG